MSDERKGTQYAQLFFEKGYENVFLLSGGFEQFLEDFNHLCEGVNVPKPKKIGKSEGFLSISCFLTYEYSRGAEDLRQNGYYQEEARALH